MKKQIILTVLTGIFLSGPVFAKQSISETVPAKSEITFNEDTPMETQLLKENITGLNINMSSIEISSLIKVIIQVVINSNCQDTYIDKSDIKACLRRELKQRPASTEWKSSSSNILYDKEQREIEDRFQRKAIFFQKQMKAELNRLYRARHRFYNDTNNSSSGLHENTAVKPETIQIRRGRENRTTHKKSLAQQ